MKRIDAKHPLAIRWFHWINFPLLLLMLWSGLLIYWANDVFRIGPVQFFPDWFYRLTGVEHRLAEGMAWHFLFMWFFAVNGAAYVIYTAASGEWRCLVPNRRSWREAIEVTLHDLRLRKTAPPARKFNGAQQIAYTSIILMGAGSLVTGLAIWKSVQFAWLTRLLGGYEAARAEHFALAGGYVLFFCVHIAQVTRTGWNNFRAMVTGDEVVTVEGPEPQDAAPIESVIRARTRRAFLVGGVAALAGGGAWEWLRTRRPDDGVQWPLRIGLRADEQLARDYFRPARLARTFPLSAVQSGRTNGMIGLDYVSDPDWKLSVAGATDSGQLSLSLADIQALPKVEEITELKCIEGWSRILQWGGVRFRDFVARYAPRQFNGDGYVGFETPGGEYYVGLDMASALHPQTLLCYEMNGRPLQPEHGAPLRLVIPVKYGVKNLKRIGTITFRSTRPPDYWAERGYDWYAGF